MAACNRIAAKQLYDGPELSELVSEEGDFVHRRTFTDPAVYELEKKHIFGRNWVYMGHESQLEKHGDFITSFIGETPVIVARGNDGEVHVNINSCSHRGVPVCRADQGNTKRFVCPYHNWSFTVEGELAAIPQERKVCNKPNKEELGLQKVPRVDSYRGLIFACMDAGVEPLLEHLGDMAWYLDCMFDRFDGGIEVIGPPHKWLINANWKLPVENQLGDVGHGPYLHGSLLEQGSPAVTELEEYGHNVVPKPGHGVAVRLMPEDSHEEQRLFGMDGIAAFDPEVADYLKQCHQKVAERLGEVRSRLKPLCYSVYPNLSFLWPNMTLRTSHPKGPGQVEYWSWFVVEKNAPEHIKQKLRVNYTMMFGPGGLLEGEDSEAWSQQYSGSNIDYADNKRFYYGLGMGEAEEHPELPGMVGSCFDEHYARDFYRHWQQQLIKGLQGEQDND
ncbi:3-phenylpropionate/cinnamic acid dioxygenase subunit alpha [Sinobacterium norvegicum]|uniref:3-phenylpropionate/cinnamic acid dioxygenase subunit alpha n=1 Tax=Sinobacterium norvegicum TaxID=1641715 RepID=A0ABM9AFM4_9GAMM|nr:Rieske 2Fe-2S domain-containing protein [Sinobacterium norvegicum]CAH0991996.1 3-phenylpropionate/cinnamic acid dioxygenase subunit alpha [Sinobacterium norvegicum]